MLPQPPLPLLRREACHRFCHVRNNTRYNHNKQTQQTQQQHNNNNNNHSPQGPLRFSPTWGSTRRGVLPPPCGGKLLSKELPVLPIPSSPAQCREDTTFTWSSDDRCYHFRMQGGSDENSRPGPALVLPLIRLLIRIRPIRGRSRPGPVLVLPLIRLLMRIRPIRGRSRPGPALVPPLTRLLTRRHRNAPRSCESAVYTRARNV